MNDNEHYDDDEFDVKSKSQIKREMHELQALGKKLTELKPDQVKKVPLSEDLAHAIRESYNIKKNEAKRRHLQFIGKLMRAEDIDAIQYAVDQFDSSSERFAQTLHEIEGWREKLIAGGNETLSEFVSTYPNVDIQRLRTLVRNAKKDQQNENNTGAAKKLFQYARSMIMPA